jgi:O-methyltransferase
MTRFCEGSAVARAKAEQAGLKRPARLSASLADWVARARQAQDPGLKEPARLTAALAEWLDARDSRQLHAAFRDVGLEVHESKPHHHYVNEYYGRGAHKLLSGLDDEEFLPLAQEVWGQGRTYLYYNRLYTLYQSVRNVVRQFPSGQLLFFEAGAYRGGSAYFMARVVERCAIDRVKLITVDTFEGHSEKDLPTGSEGVHTVEKFTDTNLEDVRECLSPFPFVEVVQGRVQDVAPNLGGQMHLIHIDVDLYAPTRFGLELAAERLPAGGIAIVDDYGFTTCPGVRKAVDEFVCDEAQGFVLQALDSGQALLLRTR